MSRTCDGLQVWARRIAIAVGLFCTMATVAHAVPITYTFTGMGQGTLNGTPFGVGAPIAFTITAIGDTGAVTSSAGNFCNPITSATYNIPSIAASGSITSPLVIVDVTGGPFIDLAIGNCTLGVLWLVGGNAAFSTYALATNIGPLALSAPGVQLGINPNVSVGGTLTFTSVSAPATFQATLSAPISTPTLSDYSLLGLAVFLAALGLIAYCRRRV